MQQNDSSMRASSMQGIVWRKSRYSNSSGECVQLAELPNQGIAIRNSRYPNGPALIYTYAEFAAFVHGVKKGDFDDLVSR